MFGYLILSRYSSVRRAAEGAPISGPIGIGNCRDGAPAAERLPPTRGFYQSTIGTVFRLANCRACRFHCQIGTEQVSYAPQRGLSLPPGWGRFFATLQKRKRPPTKAG
jgi:hypothetical protein